MINKNIVLQKLAPFNNFTKILIEDQNTGDIIQGILDNHNNYEKEYDKISELFIGDNEIETAKNVFKFLKDNVPYYVEPIEKQTLRSPSAIISIKEGADCKSYASFINGIMSSLNRKGIYKIPLAYRFASYRYDTREPQHVFAVLYPNTKNEVWIDPVLNKFDQRKEPVFIKDKKIKMALIAMSGTTNNSNSSLQEMLDYRDKLINTRDKYLIAGIITPGSQEENQYTMAIEKVTKYIQMASINGVPNINGIDFSSLTSSSSDGGIDWGNIFGKLIDTGTALITRNNQPSPSGGYVAPVQPVTTTGISTNTLLLIGAGGLALYLILRKR